MSFEDLHEQLERDRLRFLMAATAEILFAIQAQVARSQAPWPTCHHDALAQAAALVDAAIARWGAELAEGLGIPLAIAEPSEHRTLRTPRFRERFAGRATKLRRAGTAACELARRRLALRSRQVIEDLLETAIRAARAVHVLAEPP